MTATIQDLVLNEIYWLNTSYEENIDYVYQGMRGEEHAFMRDGAIIDSMRITLVKSAFIRVEGKRVTILDDNYRIDSVSKEDNTAEYERLQALWRSRTQ